MVRILVFPRAEVLGRASSRVLRENRGENSSDLRLWVAEKALRVMRHDSAGGPSGFSCCDAFHGCLARFFFFPCLFIDLMCPPTSSLAT